MLQAAARIADGQVPYRDFWWFYPPGQPLAARRAVGAARAVAADVEDRARARARARSRCWRGGSRGAAARRRGRRWRRGLAATFALAYPSGPHPFPITLALCLGALLCLERPALAGALTGVAAFWRLEFAAYLALGVLLAYAVRGGMGAGGGALRGRAAGVAAAAVRCRS